MSFPARTAASSLLSVHVLMLCLVSITEFNRRAGTAWREGISLGRRRGLVLCFGIPGGASGAMGSTCLLSTGWPFAFLSHTEICCLELTSACTDF